MADNTQRTGNVWSFTTLGPGGGIRGLYFANTSLSGLPVINRIDPQINFNWATVPTGLTANNFSVRWVGALDVPFSETYTFYPTTDDGVRLWVNDVQLLDKGGGAFTISGAGHDIGDDADDFRFAWKRLNLAKEGEIRSAWHETSRPMPRFLRSSGQALRYAQDDRLRARRCLLCACRSHES